MKYIKSSNEQQKKVSTWDQLQKLKQMTQTLSKSNSQASLLHSTVPKSIEPIYISESSKILSKTASLKDLHKSQPSTKMNHQKFLNTSKESKHSPAEELASLQKSNEALLKEIDILKNEISKKDSKIFDLMKFIESQGCKERGVNPNQLKQQNESKSVYFGSLVNSYHHEVSSKNKLISELKNVISDNKGNNNIEEEMPKIRERHRKSI